MSASGFLWRSFCFLLFVETPAISSLEAVLQRDGFHTRSAVRSAEARLPRQAREILRVSPQKQRITVPSNFDCSIGFQSLDSSPVIFLHLRCLIYVHSACQCVLSPPFIIASVIIVEKLLAQKGSEALISITIVKL